MLERAFNEEYSTGFAGENTEKVLQSKSALSGRIHDAHARAPAPARAAAGER